MKYFLITCCFFVYCSSSYSQATDSTVKLFEELNRLPWGAQVSSFTGSSWQEHWTVDGYRAEIKSTPKGTLFCAGPIARDNGSHAVLWTKENFSGSIKIEFDYTRADDISRFVNIIYIQATGIGTPPFVEDIQAWDSLRTIPTMSKYFKNMNAYHISFAAFGMDNEDAANDYVRARRYPVLPGGNFSKDTAIQPDYFQTGLFQPGVKYHITIIKKENHLVMQVSAEDTEKVFYWNTSTFPTIESGRVGVRHMYTRCAIYNNLIISVLPNDN